MYLKISFKNVKNNLKDYSIYFFTLMIGVALVYAFNSLDSQSAFTSATSTGTSNLAKTLISMMSILSKFVALILAFLIIYANNFLFKRRKKELGIYMLLGMENKNISRIFVSEIVMIGILSFIVGIGVGTVLSQGISIIALKLFAFDLSVFKFAFSVESLKTTLISFTLIFIVMILFNIRVIKKVKLIELLNASRKNEVHDYKGNKTTLGIFLAGVLSLASVVYLMYEKDAIRPDSPLFSLVFILTILGTACIIYASFGLLLVKLQKSETWYYKDLNAFLIRQISSKIKSNFITITVVCILLSATICVVATGMGMVFTLNENASDASPYDLSIYQSLDKDTNNTIESFLLEKGITLNDYMEDYFSITIYNDETLTYGNLITSTDNLWNTDKDLIEENLPIMSISDYNQALIKQGLEPIKIEKNQYLLNVSYDGSKEVLETFIKSNKSLTVNKQVLEAKKLSLQEEIYALTPMNANDKGTIIVDDSIIEGLDKSMILMGAHYKEEVDPVLFDNDLLAIMSDHKGEFIYFSKEKLYMMLYGTFAMASFVCCYIGIVFLVISVAILSLQQLCETADNVHRYELLQKLGIEKKSCHKVIFKQIAIYFGTPLTLALLYASVGLPQIINKLAESLDLNIGANVSVTLIMFMCIYFSYFIITYFGCCNMITGKLKIQED